MRWIHQFQLFLFDFDGLLVNTEDLHFAAYQKMCRDRGFELNWDFESFCKAAHFSSTGLKDGIYAEFPALFDQEPRWDVLYQEKKAAYMGLLQEGKLQLLPGVSEVLEALQKADIRRCVVTNSTKEQVECIKQALPLLKSIPVWITREQYEKPKPAPDGYLKALDQMAKPEDKVIGFEDSFRGLTSLEAAGCRGVLICPAFHPQMDSLQGKGVLHFESFSQISTDEMRRIFDADQK